MDKPGQRAGQLLRRPPANQRSPQSQQMWPAGRWPGEKRGKGKERGQEGQKDEGGEVRREEGKGEGESRGNWFT